MKKRIFIAIGIIVIATTALMFTSKKEKRKVDTKPVLVLALCDTGILKPAFTSALIYRQIKDSIKWVEDGDVYRKKKSIDTSYYYFVTGQVSDSSGVMLCNRLGKDSMLSAWIPIPNKRVLMEAGEVESKTKNYKQ